MGAPTLPAFVGVDIGTSSVKLAVLGEKLEMISTFSLRIDSAPSQEGVDGAEYVEALAKAVVAELEKLHSKHGELFVGLAGHSPSLVALDRGGRPLAYLPWYDTRAERQAAELSKLLGAREWFARTGLRPSPIFFPPKIMWLKEKRPTEFSQSKWFVQIKDYIFFALTGETTTDHSSASETQLYNIGLGRYDEEVLSILGITEENLFNLSESHRWHRALRGQDVRVVLGGVDSVVAALGAGAVDEGAASFVVGSSGCWDFVVKRLVLDFDKGFEVYRHVVPGEYVIEASLPTAGLAVDTMKRLLATDAQSLSLPELPTGIVTVPYLAGARSPHWLSKARGLVYGISVGTEPRHILAATYEGIGFWSRHVIELAGELGLRLERATVSGGLAYDPVFVEVLANVIGIPVVIPKTRDLTAIGAALLAAIGAGILDFEDVRERVEVERVVEPSPVLVRKYSALYAQYKVLVEALVGLLAREGW